MTEEKITIGMMLDPKNVDKKVNVNEIFKKTKKRGYTPIRLYEDLDAIFSIEDKEKTRIRTDGSLFFYNEVSVGNNGDICFYGDTTNEKMNEEILKYMWDMSKKIREDFNLGNEYKNEISLSLHTENAIELSEKFNSIVDKFAKTLLSNYSIETNNDERCLFATIYPTPEKIQF
ncbi:MAG: hypothetical protein J7L08_00270 [Candidatus Aenigmarchaeota archaeon]|nr:hypothetical protein [Candidatus Aenigmarchaeota archaeon]